MERKMVRVHGHEVSYRIAGEGPAILLIHGMAGSSGTWLDVLPDLARHHTVVAPDLLGHGDSAKTVGDYSLGAFASGLRDLLAILRIDRATIVGQSLGGGVAMQFAYQYPERCERLILVSSGGLGREVSWILRALAVPGSEYVLPVLFPPFVADWGNSVSRWLGDRGLRAPGMEQKWRSYASLTDAATRRSFLRTLRSVVDSGGQTVSAHDRLYLAQHVPTLLIWGERDDIIPVSHAYDAHAAMPASRLEVFEGSGHFPHVEEPRRFVEVVDDFIARTDPSEPDLEAWHQRLLDSTIPD